MLSVVLLVLLYFNQLSKANSAFHPSGVGKEKQLQLGRQKAGMIHSVSG